jgi:hypothetical protein
MDSKSRCKDDNRLLKTIMNEGQARKTFIPHGVDQMHVPNERLDREGVLQIIIGLDNNPDSSMYGSKLISTPRSKVVASDCRSRVFPALAMQGVPHWELA